MHLINRAGDGAPTTGYRFISDFAFDVDLKIPFRLAEKHRMSWGFGMCMSEGAARIHTPPAHPSIAGYP